MDKHLPEATPESVDHAHTEHIVPRRTFYAVFAVLILLTWLTTGVAFVDLGPFNTVAIRTTDGRTLERVCRTARGDPSDPLTRDDIRKRFGRDVVERGLGRLG